MGRAKMPVPIFPGVTKGQISPPGRCVWLSFSSGNGGRTSKTACAEAWFSEVPHIPGSCWLVSDVQPEVLLIPQMKLSKLVMSQHESVFYVTPACIPPNPSWAQRAPTANLKFFFLAADSIIPWLAAQEASQTLPKAFWSSDTTLPNAGGLDHCQEQGWGKIWAEGGSSWWTAPTGRWLLSYTQNRNGHFQVFKLFLFSSLQWDWFFSMFPEEKQNKKNLTLLMETW